ncbi:MAG: HlyD family efflux transporter periplasmic adaptor subunit [Zetaproteobacteria bacterium]|nr:HlyD family efflux transporter periplasmic adaptor subunit [Zetaproteobacteria bacterium]
MANFKQVHPNDAIQEMAILLKLAQRCRQASDPKAQLFLLVNDTFMLSPYRQAVFFSFESGIQSISGTVTHEANAPFVQWMESVCRARIDSKQVERLEASMFPLGIADDWHVWLPPFALWLPIPESFSFAGGVLFLARDEPWRDEEMIWLSEWMQLWGQSYALKITPSFSRYVGLRLGWGSNIRKSLRYWRWGTRFLVLVSLIVLAQWPLHLSILAPAELLPLNPSIIRAPMDGVIEEVLVEPNQHVKKGDLLIHYDRSGLGHRLKVAQFEWLTAQAEYRLQSQRALFDPESKSKLALLQSRMNALQTKVDYLRTVNEQGDIRSPQDGMIILTDPDDFLGRPVVTGERLMIVVNEQHAEIEAWIAPEDALDFSVGSRVVLYLNADPLHPLNATMRYMAHQLSERPDGHFAYRMRASLVLEKGETPRVGMKGTAKVEGEEVRLIYWVLRRPWAALRSRLGV